MLVEKQCEAGLRDSTTPLPRTFSFAGAEQFVLPPAATLFSKVRSNVTKFCLRALIGAPVFTLS